MNRDLRIVFMGTPDFAVGILKSLVEKETNIVGVVTAPDKPSGRGRKLNESAVKQYAVGHNLPVLQPTNLKSESFIEELRALKANLYIVVAFRMLPKIVWQLPEYGTFNLHASLLPQYRGAAPINWALINGEKTTGVTTFFIEEEIDTGEIILQKEIAIDAKDTAGTLHDKLMVLGSEVTLETVEMIRKGEVSTLPQSFNETLKTAPKIYSDTCQINWNDPLLTIHNFIRGLSPYPGAWTNLHQDNQLINVKIYKAHPEFIEHNVPVKSIVKNKKTLKVAVTDGFLVIDEIQLSGKKKMDVISLLNGFNLADDAYFS